MNAFSSLGNGLVRHEFGGSLALVNHKQTRRGVRAVDKCDDHCRARDDDDLVNNGAFDVPFVADPSQSWSQRDDNGRFGGYAQYESRIRAASQLYSRISLVGDSMGGSAALLFSHLAIDVVVAFSPQVDLKRDTSHVGQSDMTPGIRRKFRDMLYRGIGSALDAGMNVIVHWGSEESDVRHTNLLEDRFLSRRAKEGAARDGGWEDGDGILQVVEHPDCLHHQIAVHLKGRGMLTRVLYRDLLGGNRAWDDAPVRAHNGDNLKNFVTNLMVLVT